MLCQCLNFFKCLIFCVTGGYMEQLDNKWILVKDTKCPEKDTSPATLGLTNMAGMVFIRWSVLLLFGLWHIKMECHFFPWLTEIVSAQNLCRPNNQEILALGYSQNLYSKSLNKYNIKMFRNPNIFLTVWHKNLHTLHYSLTTPSVFQFCTSLFLQTGVFMMVAGGIVMGVILIFIEIAYKRHRGLKEKELELAKTAADRWRGNIEVGWDIYSLSVLQVVSKHSFMIDQRIIFVGHFLPRVISKINLFTLTVKPRVTLIVVSLFNALSRALTEACLSMH